MARRRPSVTDRVSDGYFQSTEPAGKTFISPDSEIKRTKRTYYLPDDVLLLLREVQLRRYRELGTEPELSDLVAEGIRRLAETDATTIRHL